MFDNRYKLMSTFNETIPQGTMKWMIVVKIFWFFPYATF